MRDTNLALIKEVADKALGTATQPESLTDGAFSDIYRINFADEVAYLKLSATEQQSLFPEYLAYETLKTLGVHTPRVLFYAEADPALRRSVLIISSINGMPMTAYPHSTLKDQALEEAGRELASINAVRIDQFGWINFAKGSRTLAGDCGSLAEFVLGGTFEGLACLSASGLISNDTRARCMTLLEQADRFLVADYPHLLHGDFTGRHIFFDGQRFSGIIDFGNIRGGSPYHDLAHLRTFDRPHFTRVLMGYQAQTKLPGDPEPIIAFEGMALLLAKVNWFRQHKPAQLQRYHWVDAHLAHEADFISRHAI